jgi:hypothetical protein
VAFHKTFDVFSVVKTKMQAIFFFAPIKHLDAFELAVLGGKLQWRATGEINAIGAPPTCQQLGHRVTIAGNSSGM